MTRDEKSPNPKLDYILPSGQNVISQRERRQRVLWCCGLSPGDECARGFSNYQQGWSSRLSCGLRAKVARAKFAENEREKGQKRGDIWGQSRGLLLVCTNYRLYRLRGTLGLQQAGTNWHRKGQQMMHLGQPEERGRQLIGFAHSASLLLLIRLDTEA